MKKLEMVVVRLVGYSHRYVLISSRSLSYEVLQSRTPHATPSNHLMLSVLVDES